MSENLQYIEKFYSYLLKERGYSPNTALAYRKDVEQYFLFVMNGAGIPHVKEIRDWVRSLLLQGRSERSVHRKVSSLRTYAKFLHSVRIIEELPSYELQLPKVKRKIPSYIKESELSKLLNTLEQEANDFRSVLHFAIVTTFYHTGIRRSELINLKNSDFDLAKNELKVLGKGNKERIIPMSNELVRVIEGYKDFKAHESIDNEIFFCNFDGVKLKEKWVYSLVNDLLNQTFGDKKSPHILRHSFANHLLQNGADINAIKELLGHSSLSATQLYAHNDISRLKEVYKDTHPFSD